MKYIVVLLIGLLPSLSSSQNTSDYTGIASMSMGGSMACLSGVNALHGNQAGIGTIDSWIVDINAIQKFGINGLNKFSSGLAYPLAKGAIGINVFSYGVSALSEQKVGVFYTRALSQNLSASAQFDWISYSIDEYGSKNLFTVELGFQAKVNKYLKLGAHIFSPGEIEFSDNNPLPSIIELGGAYLASKKFTLHSGVRKIIDRPFEVLFGMDYQVHDRLALRIGGNTAVSEFTSGVKINATKDLSILFAFSYHNSLGISPGVGFQYE